MDAKMRPVGLGSRQSGGRAFGHTLGSMILRYDEVFLVLDLQMFWKPFGHSLWVKTGGRLVDAEPGVKQRATGWVRQRARAW